MYVYAITNTVNGKVYIGQHSGDDLQKYLDYNTHAAFLPSAVAHKPALYRAIRKYGPESFEIKSLVVPVDKDQMDALETFFIRVLDAQIPEIGYNISPGGGMGGLFTPEHIEALRAGQRGKSKFRSPEHSAKISQNKISFWQARRDAGIIPIKRPQTSESLRQYYAGISEEGQRRMSEIRKIGWQKRRERQVACLTPQ